jgi:hypothetical protein
MMDLITQEEKLSVLIGAGFSKWAAGLPVASELFDFTIEPFGVRDERQMRIVRLAKNAWDQEHPDGLAEQFIAYAMSTSRQLRTAVLWFIARRLSEPYIWQEWHSGKWRRHVLMIDENRKYERPGVTLARDFILRLMPFLSGIITTNYDLLIEYALGTKLFNYGQLGEMLKGRGPYPVSQWRNPVTLQGSIALVKLHGSISWDLDGRYTDGRRGITGNALIVAPTPEKTVPAVLAHEWKLAGHILRKSDRILVFGFAFNPYDEALGNHLRQYGGNIKQVIVVDKKHKPERVKAIWPHASVQLLPPPPECEVDREDWYRNLDLAIKEPL